MRWFKMLLLFFVGLGFVGRVAAQEPPLETWRVPFPDLGLPETLRLQGAVAEQTYFVPLAKGIRATYLEADMVVSPDVVDGYVEVRSQDRLLATVPFTNTVCHVRVPLEQARVQDNVMPLTLRARIRSDDDVCTTSYVGGWLEWQQPTLTFEGVPQSPARIGEFWPPVVHDVHIVVPPAPSPVEAEAALRIAAAVAQRYRAVRPTLHIEALREDGPFPPPSAANPTLARLWERRIVIRETSAVNRLTLDTDDMPTLRLEGSPDALRMQSRLVASRLVSAVVARTADAITLAEAETVGRDLITFAELQPPTLNLFGVGRMTIPLAVSQADLGGPVKTLALRLSGTHTPPPETAHATLSVYVNEGLVHAVPLNQSGFFDLYIPVAGALLQRDNTIRIQVDYTPPGGNCEIGAHPFGLTLSPQSYLAFERGGSLPPGFGRIPQSLLPTFDVAFDRLDLAALRAAALLTAEWQRLTRTPLDPRVQSLESVVAARTPALVLAHVPDNASAFNPPLQPTPFRVLDVNGQEIFTMGMDAPFGVLEAFEQRGRMVVLLTQQGDMPLDATAQKALASPNGWYDLQGDVLIVPEQGDPVALSVRTGAVRVEPLTPSRTMWWQRLRPLVYAFLLFGTTLFLAWAYPRVVQKQPKDG
ncbi:hypothetical protein ARMA_0221 [Ardenticatena maritima]|uniref:Cyclic di-GMP-binding protein n=1 Tax=Ardenticatena maritima TaxID=872965 RepID=A0A0M9UBE9_9CHLR|nr:cellulose biosynthesis cyclic di-GMP-binding regulatory protein BcsB [Ardenticatena maritima]KPL87916.1 hypothetical protein SE16_10315 [Ardenticatena maritima]GAP61798.1 hypothetical protein ARMA_0221 [Ardenticatena maritima]